MTLAVLMRWSVGALSLGGLSAQDGDDLGQVTYDRWCAGCHGVDGTGERTKAPTTCFRRPRDFTLALYNIRTTASGDLPTDQDHSRHHRTLGCRARRCRAGRIFFRTTRRTRSSSISRRSRVSSLPMRSPQQLDFGRATTRSNADVLAEGERVYRDHSDRLRGVPRGWRPR